MDNFEDVISRWVEETQLKIDDTLQDIVLLIGKNLITLSPVDTGLFKGNWQLSIGTGTNSSLLRHDPTGSAALSDLLVNVRSFTVGQIAYIQNHLTYGYDLEYGSSQQAPDGVLRVTEARFLRIVNEAIALNQ
jgi:hypothetical protein